MSCPLCYGEPYTRVHQAQVRCACGHLYDRAPRLLMCELTPTGYTAVELDAHATVKGRVGIWDIGGLVYDA